VVRRGEHDVLVFPGPDASVRHVSPGSAPHGG
jgi:hypothetical protein